MIEAHPNERLAQSILIDRNGRLVEFRPKARCAPICRSRRSRRAQNRLQPATFTEGGVTSVIQTGHGGDQFAARAGAAEDFDQGGLLLRPSMVTLSSWAPTRR